MESITMTIDAKHARVLSVCPEAGPRLLASSRDWTRGTSVSAAAVTDARGNAVYTDGPFFDQIPTTPMDVAFLRSGGPPV